MPWWQGVISPQQVPGCWRAAVRGARGKATTTSVTRATLRLRDKATGNTFMSQFLCNWITLLHGEGERRRKKRRYFLLVQKQTHGYSYPSSCASRFHKDVRRKGFPVAKYPGKEISQLLNYSIFLELGIMWNTLYMKTGGDPASSWSDLDLSLPGLSKMSSQHITCRSWRENLYRHAQNDK